MPDDLSKATEDSARGGFFLFSGSTLATIIMAIAAIIVGRRLGTDAYGQYNLVITIPALVLLFTDLGISTGITKFTADLHKQGNDQRAYRIIRYGLWFRLLVGILATALSIIFAGYLALIVSRPQLALYVQIVSIAIIFQILFTTTNAAFVGMDKTEYNALTTNLQAIAKTVLQVSFVLVTLSLTGVFIGYVGGYVTGAIAGTILLLYKLIRPTNNTPKTKTPPESQRQILNLLEHYGWPLYLSTVLTGLTPLYQKAILGYFSSNTNIGNYSAASNFITLLAIIPTSITTALLPAFSKLGTSSTPDVINAFFKRANKYTCLLIVPTAALLLIFSNQVIGIVMGSAYSPAAQFLAFSTLVYFLAAFGSLSLTSLFNGLAETTLTLKVGLISLTVVIALSPIFAQIDGVTGVVLANLAGGIASTFYAAYIGVHKLKVQFEATPTAKIYLAGLLASLLPLLLLHFMGNRYLEVFLIGVFLYLLVYITLTPLIGIVDERELAALERMTTKIRGLNKPAKPVIQYMRKIHSLRHRTKET